MDRGHIASIPEEMLKEAFDYAVAEVRKK